MIKKHSLSLTIILITLAVQLSLQATPVINEIAPFNNGILADAEGEYPDWIEIHNPDATSVDLSGWFLTDKSSALNQWTFPLGTIIPAQGYLIVFASGKNNITSEHHTNFSLAGSGEYLALVQADGTTVVDEYTQDQGTGYPAIPNHVSYGVSGSGHSFFATATPGTANSTGSAVVSSSPSFSHTRGHYMSAFDLSITSEATIHYTTDGSEPTSTTGILYTTPFEVNTTTVVRAIAYQSGGIPSKISTHTYLFAASTVNQNVTTATNVGFPENEWGFINPTRPSGNHRFPENADYAMDPTVVNNPIYDVEKSLRSIPTVSLSMPSDHFFKESTVVTHGTDPSEGIYVNPGGLWPGGGNRDDWERAASFEYIPARDNTNGATDTQEDCGLRMQGLSSATPQAYRKFSFRAIFRKEYGASKLEHDIFPNDSDAATRHNSLILRAGSSDKWDTELMGPVLGIDDVQYLRDSFVRYTQIAMQGTGATGRSDWVHIYINGVYWGLYNMIERTDQGWLSENEGGDDSDYQVERDGTQSTADSENTPNWSRLNTQLRDAGPVIDQAHYVAAAEALDPRSFAEYIMANQVCQTQDWPGANFSLHTPNDSSIRGWRFTAEGADQSLVAQPGNELAWMTYRRSRFVTSNPGTFWEHYRANPHFRELFADLIHKHMLTPGGALTIPILKNRYQAEVDLIRSPLAAESARWGDSQLSLRTPAEHWEPLVTRTHDTFFDYIIPTYLSIYEKYGLTATISAPIIDQAGNQLLVDSQITINGPENSTIYYTTDGSDPKSALDYTHSIALTNSAAWTRLKTNNIAPNWATPSFNDNGWAQGNGEIRVPTNDAETFEYVRYSFNIPNQASLDLIHGISLTAAQRYNIADIYINGVEQISEIAAENASLSKDFTRSLSRAVPNLVVGENIIGLRFVKNAPGDSAVFDGTFTLLGLNIFTHNSGSNQPKGTPYTAPVSVFSGLTNIKARARDNITGRWSALSEGSFETGLLDSNLIISEFNYRPHKPSLPEETAISTDRDDFEFIEFSNIGTVALDLTGYYFSNGITFNFPDNTSIPAGDRLLIVRNEAAFTARYGVLSTPIISEYSGSLSNDGERITVNAPQGPIIDFTYNDRAPWPDSADGDGPSLILIAPNSQLNADDPASWRLSSTIGGNPGSSDAVTLASWLAVNNLTNLTGDADQDGLNNLVEFATGSDPAGFTPNILTIEETNESGLVSLSANLNISAMDEVTMVIERSFDLINWQETPVNKTGDVYHNNGCVTSHYSNQLNQLRTTFYRIKFLVR